MPKKTEFVLNPSMVADTLIGKLIEAGIECGVIGKSGENTAQGYKFTSEADVVKKVGPALFRRGIIATPSHSIHSIIPYLTKNQAQAFLTTIETVWRFQNEQGYIDVTTVGQGTDTGGDKGVYKAMTGSKKYALLQALMIATGDDPEVARPGEAAEADEREEQDPNGKPTQKQVAKLFAMAKEARVEDVPAFVKQITGKFSSKQLKVSDMQGLFDTLATLIATGGTLDGEPLPTEDVFEPGA